MKINIMIHDKTDDEDQHYVKLRGTDDEDQHYDT